MPGRFLMVSYDDCCRAPLATFDRLMTFVGLRADPAVTRSLLPLIRQADTIGRFQPHGLDHFDASDVEYVRSLGFDVASERVRTMP
ncbi:MAG: hypothetical protein R2712_03740 [Vicinamibacterales bacterium]